MKESKQFAKMAKKAARVSTSTRDVEGSEELSSLAEAFRVQAEVLKKSKA
jgi:hypothetical protein